MRRTDREAWREHMDPRGHTLLHPPSWLHARVLYILMAVVLTCGGVSVVTLGTDPARTWWELALRLFSLALVVTALAFCVRAFRCRDPRRGSVGNLLFAVAALVAAVAVTGVAAWAST